MKKWIIVIITIISMISLTACDTKKANTDTDQTPPIVDNNDNVRDYCEGKDDSCINFVEEYIEGMSLAEKAGQMVQGERNSVTYLDVKNYNLGSVLSGGGSAPNSNTPDAWFNMYENYQNSAVRSSSGIPLIYGIDSVHGNNNLMNATMFPHNIGLGAANDADLMYEIGKIVSSETKVTGINWIFAPAVSIVQDVRWGRSYESFSEDPDIVKGLTKNYILGLQTNNVSATAKHFVGDGGTTWVNQSGYPIDRGDVKLTEQEIRDLHLPPYYDAIEAGVDTIMVSYSSINGEKMHGNTHWVQDILKDEMGFEGFIISDWDGIHELPGDHYTQVVNSINAGVDMLMEPHDWKTAIDDIKKGYINGDITEERLNDAVRRILTVKYNRGLFDNPTERLDKNLVGKQEHLDVAREAVRKSLVLLKNTNSTLPIAKTEKIAVVGPGADNIGLQLGGWSISWQGEDNANLTRGTSIKDGLETVIGNNSGELVSSINEADTVIVVLAETPYAEGIGDDGILTLTGGVKAHAGNAAALQMAQEAKEAGKKVIGILLSGRPLILDNHLDKFDSFVVAWLPGSEGGLGIADVLLGDYNFTGKLPVTWTEDATKFKYNSNSENYDATQVQFPIGFGLNYNE